MKAILRALADGTEMNAALAQHVAPLETLDAQFLEDAKSQAAQLGGSYTFERPESIMEKAIAAITPENNYFDEMEALKPAIEAEDWETARVELEAIIEKSGYLPGEENAHKLLAYVYEQLGETELEKETLTQIAENEGHTIEPIERLLFIALEQDDPPSVLRWANQWIAIRPMAVEPWRALFSTHARFQYEVAAIPAGQVLLELDPPDVAKVHYALAQQHLRRDPEAAKRHTLMALEEAPRFRLAYELLDTLNRRQSKSGRTP
jgi:tetratricopeptide (TPR) repeat protein